MAIYDKDGNELVASLEPFDNDIPTVSLTGTLPTTKSEGELSIALQYKSATKSFTAYATAKVQGDTSQGYAKKNYTLKLFSDSGRTKKKKIGFRDWKDANKFVLKANWVDHSHARNIVNARLWTQIYKSRNDFDLLPDRIKNSKHLAVDGFPVKVFANGIYMGLYTWNVPKSALYDLDDDVNSEALIQGNSAIYTGSLLFRASNDDAGKWSDETHDVKTAQVLLGWNRVLNFVYTSSDADFVAHFSDYFDKQSIIDQYIFIYTGCIVDNLGKNQTFFTYNGTYWYGGMYDMDGTWGLPAFPPKHSSWYGYNTAFQTGYTVYTDSDSHETNLLYDRVGSLFASDIQSRYEELRESVLTADNILVEFDRFMSTIPETLYEEDYASTTGNGAFTSIPLHSDDHKLQIRQFVNNRLAYVDSMILT